MKNQSLTSLDLLGHDLITEQGIIDLGRGLSCNYTVTSIELPATQWTDFACKMIARTLKQHEGIMILQGPDKETEDKIKFFKQRLSGSKNSNNSNNNNNNNNDVDELKSDLEK